MSTAQQTPSEADGELAAIAFEWICRSPSLEHSALVLKLLKEHAHATAALADAAAALARQAYGLAIRCNVYDAPTIAQATERAHAFLDKEAPGMPARLRGRVLSDIQRSWLY